MSERICKNCKHYHRETPTSYGKCYRNPQPLEVAVHHFCGEWEAKTLARFKYYSTPAEWRKAHPPKEEPDIADRVYYECPKCNHTALIPNHVAPTFRIQCHKCLAAPEYEDWRKP